MKRLSKTLMALVAVFFATATYAQDKAAATALVKVGDLPKPAELDDSELAAWTAIGNVLLNLNETISN